MQIRKQGLLDWARSQRNRIHRQMESHPDIKILEDEYENWNTIVDRLMRYEDDMVNRTELIHKLRNLEKFNDSEVPDWVIKVIEGR